MLEFQSGRQSKVCCKSGCVRLYALQLQIMLQAIMERNTLQSASKLLKVYFSQLCVGAAQLAGPRRAAGQPPKVFIKSQNIGIPKKPAEQEPRTQKHPASQSKTIDINLSYRIFNIDTPFMASAQKTTLVNDSLPHIKTYDYHSRGYFVSAAGGSRNNPDISALIQNMSQVGADTAALPEKRESPIAVHQQLSSTLKPSKQKAVKYQKSLLSRAHREQALTQVIELNRQTSSPEANHDRSTISGDMSQVAVNSRTTNARKAGLTQNPDSPLYVTLNDETPVSISHNQTVIVSGNAPHDPERQDNSAGQPQTPQLELKRHPTRRVVLDGRVAQQHPAPRYLSTEAGKNTEDSHISAISRIDSLTKKKQISVSKPGADAKTSGSGQSSLTFSKLYNIEQDKIQKSLQRFLMKLVAQQPGSQKKQPIYPNLHSTLNYNESGPEAEGRACEDSIHLINEQQRQVLGRLKPCSRLDSGLESLFSHLARQDRQASKNIQVINATKFKRRPGRAACSLKPDGSIRRGRLTSDNNHEQFEKSKSIMKQIIRNQFKAKQQTDNGQISLHYYCPKSSLVACC